MRCKLWPMWLCAMVVVGCGPSSTLEDLGGASDGGKCTPGATQSCVCLGGGQGTQACRANGTSFGTCAGCSNDVPDLPTSVDPGGNQCGDCDGCCDGSTCVKLADQTDGAGKCGGRGSTCAPCSGGKICVIGTGVCGSSTGGNCSDCATGCCQDGACLADQNVACGPSCTKCTYGVSCVNGSCVTALDSNAQFKIYVQSVQLTPNDPTGSSWDGFGGGEADPYACFAYESGGRFIEGCSKYCNDTLTCTYADPNGLAVDSNGSPVLVPATIIMAGKLRITGNDDDSPLSPDQAGQGPFPATSTYQTSYQTGMFGNVVNIVFELR